MLHRERSLGPPESDSAEKGRCQRSNGGIDEGCDVIRLAVSDRVWEAEDWFKLDQKVVWYPMFRSSYEFQNAFNIGFKCLFGYDIKLGEVGVKRMEKSVVNEYFV